MKRTTQWLGTASAFALAAAPTMAMAGTTQGTSIQNTVSVAYSVGGVAQTAVQASDTFVVDRKVDFTVTAQDASAVTVVPGQTSATLKYKVTNLTNDVQDFTLTATQPNTGTAFGGTDNFDATNVKIWVDADNDGVLNTTNDRQVTSLYHVASGGFATVFVVADIPSTQVNNDIASITLTATAATGVTQTLNYAGTGGTTQTATSGADTKTTVDTVLAESADSAGGTANNGVYAARDDFKVSTASLTVAKYSYVFSDPINGTTNPKAIPGATVEYCIVVKNATGAAAATSVTITDVVPSTLTYTASTVWLGGTFNGTDRCDTATGSAGSDATNYVSASKTVTNNFGTMSANTTNTLRFRATVN